MPSSMCRGENHIFDGLRPVDLDDSIAGFEDICICDCGVVTLKEWQERVVRKERTTE